jgi:hypothetical protein
MVAPHIVSGCIGIIKSSQQLTLNHSVFRPARQQSTVNNYSGATGIDIRLFEGCTEPEVVKIQQGWGILKLSVAEWGSESQTQCLSQV